MKKHYYYSLLAALFLQSGINAQDNAAPSFNFKNGLGIASPDSAFTMNIRFRIQNRAAFTVAQEGRGHLGCICRRCPRPTHAPPL